MKVCFFSPTAYSYFNPSEFTWAGGAEIQQVQIAQYMKNKGVDVSFIVGDYGQADVEIIGGITIIKSFNPFEGNRKLRFIPDMFKVFKAMKIADADIYNQRSTSFYTGQLAFFASHLGKRFTFSIGIDYNCERNCGGHLVWPMCHLYRYGIKKADAVIAQTEKQKALLKKNFGIDAVVIRNGVFIPKGIEPRLYSSEQAGANYDSHKTDFLWVGSIRRRKRPELFIELAKKVKEAHFTMIGGEGDDRSFYKKIVESAAHVSNLSYIGFVPPDKIHEYYRRAYAYINTSYLEGFPNTYLHSWIYGVPTITIEIDPDGIIENNALGKVCGSFENLVETVRRFCSARKERDEMSMRAFQYVRSNHRIEDKAQDYIDLFESLLKGNIRYSI